MAWHSPRESTPGTEAPPLHLPIGLRIEAVAVTELQLDDAAPWHDVHAGIYLGDNDGTEHRIQDLSLHNDRVRLSADARIGTAAPLPLALQLRATPLSGTPWQASVSADGPLADFTVRATLRGDERNASAPNVDVRARIEPFANWPLAALQLSTRSLDLAALSSAAPRTRIDAQANVQSAGLDRPAQASVRVQNHEPGRWDSGRLPVRELQLELGGTPSRLDHIEIRQLDAWLADERQSAGRVQGRGQWAGSELQLQLQLADVEPARLHVSVPPLRAGGALTLQLSGMPMPAAPNASAPTTNRPTTGAPWRARVDGTLDGTLSASARPLHAQFKLSATADAVELTQARVSAGEASVQATLKAQRQRDGGHNVWHLDGDGELTQFDPLPWWPGAADTVWARGPHRANGRWQLDLQVPETLAETLRRQRESALATLRGQLQLDLKDSVLAGLPMTARLDVKGDGQALGVRASWVAAGNLATLEGRFAAAAAQDHWQLDAAWPALAALQPLSSLVPAVSWPRAGGLTLRAQLDGRWPQLQAGSGSLQANGVLAGALGLTEGLARWQFGGRDDASLELTLTAKGLQQGAHRVDDLQARVDGTLRSHRITAHAETPARPPAWSENLIGSTGTGTRATLEARGAWLVAPAGGGRWQADDASLRVVAREGKGDPWLDVKGLQGALVFDAQGAL
ncbi:MAG TPA: hypothetical protein VIY30_16115, partial [Burkholderiaceae bacterium]